MCDSWGNDDGDDTFEDDAWDDECLIPAKEEPDCFSCNDRGCRWCAPSRLDIWRNRLTEPLRWLRWRMYVWRHGERAYCDEAPF